MAVESTEEFLSSLTVLEAAELAKMLEDKWGVSAAAPSANAGSASEEASPGIDVILTGDGGKKISVIKEVRAITGLGLTEAKALVERVPTPVVERAPRNRAEEVRAQLERAGATVSLAPMHVEEELGDEHIIADVISSMMSSLDTPEAHLAYVRARLIGIADYAHV